jgi:hypothetical protein
MVRRALFLLTFLLAVAPGSAIAAITWVDNGSGATAGCNGTTSCTTTSSPVAGDTLVAFAFRDGNATPPTVPAGWTTLDNTSGGANNNGSSIAYKSAAGGAEASGTFTSATTLIVEVYRGVDQSKFNSGAGEGMAEGTGATITEPGTDCGGTLTCTKNFTLGVNDGTSWIFVACGHRQVDTNLETATLSAVLTLRQNPVDATDEGADFDTNAGVSTFTGGTKGLGGTNGGWACRTQELEATVTATVHNLGALGVGS